jgi:hypothetical protein
MSFPRRRQPRPRRFEHIAAFAQNALLKSYPIIRLTQERAFRFPLPRRAGARGRKFAPGRRVRAENNQSHVCALSRAIALTPTLSRAAGEGANQRTAVANLPKSPRDSGLFGVTLIIRKSYSCKRCIKHARPIDVKVVVQNGANHCLSRKDAELVASLLPRSWSSSVQQVLLAGGDSLSTSFHPKERVLCLYCPSGPAQARNKGLAVYRLLHALAAAAGAEVSESLERDCMAAVGGRSA